MCLTETQHCDPSQSSGLLLSVLNRIALLGFHLMGKIAHASIPLCIFEMPMESEQPACSKPGEFVSPKSFALPVDAMVTSMVFVTLSVFPLPKTP